MLSQPPNIPLNTAGTTRIRLEGHYTHGVNGVTSGVDRSLAVWLHYRF